MTHAAGVDVGGTKIDACIADPLTGGILARARIPSLPGRPGQDVLDDCVALVHRLAGDRPLSTVGVGVCEFVDRAGVMTSAFTLDWLGMDVASSFAALAPASVCSDVRAAALAEARFGAGQRLSEPWIYLSVGTGISYSLVVEGRPFEGARGNAIVVGAPPTEQIASGLGLARAAGRSRAEDVLDDPGCADVVATGATALGTALAMLVNALDPATIVVGGGLGLEARYRDAAVAVMRDLIEAAATRDVPVVPAGLGDLAGPLGAAIAGFDWGASETR
jgi:predicted NBD/HSP70 family sugar kinase